MNPGCYINGMHTDTSAVRKGEELDVGALGEYLRSRIDGVAGGIVVEQFPGGHSNLTYLLTIGGLEYVLRRAPLGPVAPKAHDMVREARVLSAVHPHFPPAPKVYLVCEDAGVIGAPFFLMERRKGIVLRDRVPPEVCAHENYADRISRAFVDCLVELHAVDVEGQGLTSLGKPEGFVERQVKGWSERWERARTEANPEMDRVMAWLAATIPPSGTATLVHNDFKLDNVMLDTSSPDRIEAVLDWEMTTVGEPLCDVGLTLCYWSSVLVPGTSSEAITAGPGWYSRDEFVEQYSARTGRDCSALPWHEVLGVFKLAVILQQIYFRFWRGQTTDERFRTFDQRVKALTGQAARMVEKIA
ncbi:MAG TPA: phosphotransferase family protein [Bryobacteraceae bacterium]|nr:phosphotransferase family protein [Bryobacteraceae bacterium]